MAIVGIRLFCQVQKTLPPKETAYCSYCGRLGEVYTQCACSPPDWRGENHYYRNRLLRGID